MHEISCYLKYYADEFRLYLSSLIYLFYDMYLAPVDILSLSHGCDTHTLSI